MGRCNLCNKKCGLLSIECKGCEKVFCSVHRLPEDHQCPCMANYKDSLKEQLKDSLMKQQHDLKDLTIRNNYVRM